MSASSRRRPLAVALVAIHTGLTAWGCKAEVRRVDDAAAPSSAGQTSAVADAAPRSPPSSDSLTCRLTALEGRALLGARADGGAGDGGATREAIEGSFVDRREQLELAPDAGATVTRALSGRELRVVGPASLVPCVADGLSWLYEGTVDSVASVGAAPGRTTWIVTPTVVVRWTSARVRVGVAPSGRTTVAVASGSVQVRTLDDADRAHATPDGGPDALTEIAAPTTREFRVPARAVATSVARCHSSLARVHALSTVLLHASGAGERSRAGADLVTAQEIERADCALAELLATREGDATALAAIETARARSAWIH